MGGDVGLVGIDEGDVVFATECSAEIGQPVEFLLGGKPRIYRKELSGKSQTAFPEELQAPFLPLFAPVFPIVFKNE